MTETKSTLRYDIIQKGDGRILVRTINSMRGGYAVCRDRPCETVEEAREYALTLIDIARVRDAANRETILESFEL